MMTTVSPPSITTGGWFWCSCSASHGRCLSVLLNFDNILAPSMVGFDKILLPPMVGFDKILLPSMVGFDKILLPSMVGFDKILLSPMVDFDKTYVYTTIYGWFRQNLISSAAGFNVYLVLDGFARFR